MRASCSIIRPVAARMKNTMPLILGFYIILSFIFPIYTLAATWDDGNEALDNQVGVLLGAPGKRDDQVFQHSLLTLRERSFDLTWGVTAYFTGMNRNNYQDDLGVFSLVDDHTLPHFFSISNRHMPLTREISLVLPPDGLKRAENSGGSLETDKVATTKSVHASEPAAILLFGLGLLWVARWGKRKYSQEGFILPVWDRLFGSFLQGKTTRATNCAHGSGVHRKPEA
jgi:hypothetical protein